MVSRRGFVKGIIGLAAAGTFAAGYARIVEEIVKPTYTPIHPDPVSGDKVKFVYSSCLGCNVRCGIRAKVVEQDGVSVVERIEGNPYHPYNRLVNPTLQNTRFDPLPYSTPAVEGLKYAGTLCARGQDGIHYLYDPYRIKSPLKRAGARGSGKWKKISWSQLIKEVVEGGVVEETGERIPGLKEIFVYGILRDAGIQDPNKILSEIKKDIDTIVQNAPKLTADELKDEIQKFKDKWSKQLSENSVKLEQILINPDMPDLGFKSNQLVFVRGRGQAHADDFYQRWTYAFGSVNWLRHTSACQLGFYCGNRIWAGTTDLSPDVRGAKVLIMAGAQIGRLHPGATGQGLIIERAAKGELKVFYVNPVSPRGDCGGNFEWVPIKPGSDAALALAIVRWIFDNKRFNKAFLESPNEEAAKSKGEVVYTNATWLVVTEPNHAKEGVFLKASDLGIGDSSKYVVYADGFKAHTDVKAAEILYKGRVKLASGEEVEVKTALQILNDEAASRSLDEWSAICGVPVQTIIRMAEAFTSVGRAASTYIHRGIAMHPQAEYSVWAYRALDLLIGNYFAKGGVMGRASTTNFNGYLYSVGTSGFGEPVRFGPYIDRHGVVYENTLEYWLKSKSGLSPYPAKRPWYPFTPEESYTELFAGISEEYPYPIRALFLYYANPVISANYGLKFIEVLKDTQKLPLFVAITTSINETYLYADYIVPDTTYLETGTLGCQYLYASSGGVSLAESWRTMVIPPLTDEVGRDPAGRVRYASMWEFLIDIAKALGMPGFGENGIKGVAGGKYEGKSFPLNSLWDYIMRVYANGAMDAVRRKIVPSEVPKEDVEFVESNYPIAEYRDIIPDEWPYVAYVLARGGVFTSYKDSYDEKGFVKRTPPRTLLEFWDERLAQTRNSITGKRFYGGPKYFEPSTYAPIAEEAGERWQPGTPLRRIWSEAEYPMLIVPNGSPLFTKHRSQFYYWLKQIMPRNFAVIHPDDASKINVATGDIIKIETPNGSLETPVLVEPTVARGVIAIPVGMGRWVENVVSKPKYFQSSNLQKHIDELPNTVVIPEEAVNPVKKLPKVVKKLLFTKSQASYYDNGLSYDEWRFNGITPTPISSNDPSLGGWPLLSWLGASQVYFYTPARISKTGRSEKIWFTEAVW
ncbi:MAG: molybdopterin-dependent oxidoreductase [Nitrososphaerales archaeon]